MARCMLGSIRSGRCNLLNGLIELTRATPSIAVGQDRAVRWKSPKRLQLVSVFGSMHLPI